MSSKKISIGIDEPCSQNWDEMIPNANGRYCAHCTKVVKDFTVMSDGQIKEFFQNYRGEVCGRFHNRQLEQTYAFGIRQTPRYLNRFLQFAISGLLTLKIADSTAESHSIKTEQRSVDIVNREETLLSVNDETKKFVEGKVVAQDGESALATTIVKIEETG